MTLEMLEKISAKKMTLTTSYEDADVIISLNPRGKSKWDSKTIALCGEPKVVRPDLYSKKRAKRFLEFIPTSQFRADKVGAKYWIQLPVELPPLLKWNSERRKRAVMVIGNKISANQESNYRLRRQVIRLDEKMNQQIDVFGVDWLDPLWLQFRRRINAARIQLINPLEFSWSELMTDFLFVPKNYRGVMPSNFKSLTDYQIAVVIENESDYISEKLWICLCAGVIPVYVGPSLKEYPGLEEVVYEVDKSPKQIIELISTINIEEIEQRRKNIRKIINQLELDKQKERFALDLIRVIQDVSNS